MSTQDRYRRVESLFHQLVDLDAAARAARIAELGAAEPALAAELSALLSERPAVDERVLDELARDAKVLALTAGMPEHIGPYRVLRLLGEGGMGRVYEAEQQIPVQRRVAVKLTHGGRDNARVMARFHAERQALALLDHPNIARIFDVGTHNDGRPWFAMELVDGVPITQWAEAHDSDLRERLELLLPVCDAIGHAHRKGVIHRDLKPSNILVAEVDGKPVPKIIDFGIAKALYPLGEEIDVTRAGELIGTPEYMSPEQASLGAVDVDTRSDVYALGLVLFELLVGQLPLALDDLRRVAFDEMCRRIREDEPPRPSVVLDARARTTVGESGPRWARRVAGDLDAVVLKALAKDRERRYDSVAGFADDLRRFLSDQPVQATPPSRRYRLRKFVKRNRAASIAVAIVAVTVLIAAGMAVRSWVAVRDAVATATAAQQRADAINRFLLGLFAAADPRKEPGRDPTARDLLARGLVQLRADTSLSPDARLDLLESLGDAAHGLGDYAQAAAMFEEAATLHAARMPPDPARHGYIIDRLGVLARDRGDLAVAAARHREALVVFERAGLGSSAAALRARGNLAIVLRRQGELAAAAEAYATVIAGLGGDGATPSEQLAGAWLNLAAVLQDQGDLDGAIATQRKALDAFQAVLPPDHPNFAVVYNNMSVVARNAGRLHDALDLIRRAKDNEAINLPADHPDRADGLHNEAAVLVRLGELDLAEARLVEALALLARTLAADNPRTWVHRDTLAEIRMRRGENAEASAAFEALLAEMPADGASLRQRLASLRKLGIAQRAAGLTAAAMRSADMSIMLASEAGRAPDQALGLLLAALLALDAGDAGKAAEHYAAAVRLLPACEQGACALDQGNTHLIRAQYLARTAPPAVALAAAAQAVQHGGWSATMLDAGDFAALRSDPGWAAIEAALAARLVAPARTPSAKSSRPGRPVGTQALHDHAALLGKPSTKG
jgi:serine/threonine protein kinase/tetratricopeptide (TPR) repeat protein